MNRSVYRDVADEALLGVQPSREKFVFDGRSGRCACASRVLRADAGRRPDAPLPTSNAYCHPRALPFDRSFDLACGAGARRIVFPVEPWPFSWQSRYPEALVDIAFRADGFNRCVFCG